MTHKEFKKMRRKIRKDLIKMQNRSGSSVKINMLETEVNTRKGSE